MSPISARSPLRWRARCTRSQVRAAAPPAAVPASSSSVAAESGGRGPLRRRFRPQRRCIPSLRSGSACFASDRAASGSDLAAVPLRRQLMRGKQNGPMGRGPALCGAERRVLISSRSRSVGSRCSGSDDFAAKRTGVSACSRHDSSRASDSTGCELAGTRAGDPATVPSLAVPQAADGSHEAETALYPGVASTFPSVSEMFSFPGVPARSRLQAFQFCLRRFPRTLPLQRVCLQFRHRFRRSDSNDSRISRHCPDGGKTAPLLHCPQESRPSSSVRILNRRSLELPSVRLIRD